MYHWKELNFQCGYYTTILFYKLKLLVKNIEYNLRISKKKLIFKE